MARSGIAVLVLLLGGGAATGLYFLRGGDASRATAAARSIHPEQHMITNTVNATGTVRLRVGSEVRVGSQLSGIVKKLNVTPEDNDTSRALTKQAAEKRAELAKLDGSEFDKAHIANEVAYHKTVSSALEKTLIPSASYPELKSLLQTGLKLFQGHEQHAEQVAAELR